MSYIAPGPAAADFDLDAGPYIAPGPAAADFDLAALGGAPLVYPPVPGVVASFATPWNRPARQEGLLAVLFRQAAAQGIERQVATNQAGSRHGIRIALSHAQAEKRDRGTAVPWGAPVARDSALTAPSNQSLTRDIEGATISWALAGVHLDPPLAAPFLVKTPWKDRQATEVWRSSAVFAPLWKREDHFPEALGLVQNGIANINLERNQRPYTPGHLELGASFENNPIQPKDPTPVFRHRDAPNQDLRHRIPWGPSGSRDTTLRFEYPDYDGPVLVPGEAFPIPIRRLYVVSNSAQIVRVSDGLDIPAQAVTLSTSFDDFAWTMSATLSGSEAIALAEGTDAEPVEVDVTVNGVTWRIVIDGWTLQEAALTRSGRINGRSRSAYLASPYASVRDYQEASQLLTQQMAAQELPPGWGLTWNIDSWIVPGGIWNYQGLAPIDAISRIAAAGGGFVQSALASDEVIVRRRYPSAPWTWALETPDFLVPRDVILQRGSQKKPGKGMNGVFVHGATGGVLARVKRTGTAGDQLLPTIVDALITDIVPARHRGIAALAQAMRQATETHELPLSENLGGLILPGQLVGIGEGVDNFVKDWTGVVSGVTVSAVAARAGDRGVNLKVRQSLDIERYFEE